MGDGPLTVLKFCLLALLYLFLARVLWTVALELRGGGAAAAVAPVDQAAKDRRRKQWRLVVVEPPGVAAEFPVDGELTIGRAAGCGIALADDTFVSQVHARAFERDGDVYVEDLGSTNGTEVDGERLQAARRLRKGDRVQIGHTTLEARR